MTDATQAKVMIASALILLTYWLLVFSIPFLVLTQAWVKFPWGFRLVCCASIGYFTWTGVRAWRRGWKARFILRIVVPGALLVAACGIILLLAIMASTSAASTKPG